MMLIDEFNWNEVRIRHISEPGFMFALWQNLMKIIGSSIVLPSDCLPNIK